MYVYNDSKPFILFSCNNCAMKQKNVPNYIKFYIFIIFLCHFLYDFLFLFETGNIYTIMFIAYHICWFVFVSIYKYFFRIVRGSQKEITKFSDQVF